MAYVHTRAISRVLWIACAIMSGGCSVQLAYQNAQPLLASAIDGYLDLERTQREFLDARLGAHLEWHASSEMPKYSAFLRDLGREAGDGLSREEIDAAFREFREAVARIVTRVTPDAAALLSTLSTEQIDHFQRRLERKNRRDAEKYLEPTPEQRLMRRAERIVEHAEKWVGPLSETQIERIRALNRSLPSLAEQWLADRVRRQQLLLAALREGRSQAALEQIISDILLRPEIGREPAYAHANSELVAGLIGIVAELDATLSTRQREHLLEHIAERAEDVEWLATRS